MEIKRHIFFIGMMGTGKTTVGRKLAEEIGCPWVDMDQRLEAKFGFSIAEYFQQYGEKAFRQEESRLLKRLIDQSPAVITTGGGIVLNPENRMRMKKHGWVVHLTATPEELIRRLKGDQSRPLLAGDLEKRIRQISNERAKLYQFAHVTIDTTNQTPDQIRKKIKDFLFNSSSHRSSY